MVPNLKFVKSSTIRVDVFCGESQVATIDNQANGQYVVLHFIYRPDHNTKIFKHNPDDPLQSCKEAVEYIQDRFAEYLNKMEFIHASNA